MNDGGGGHARFFFLKPFQIILDLFRIKGGFIIADANLVRINIFPEPQGFLGVDISDTVNEIGIPVIIPEVDFFNGLNQADMEYFFIHQELGKGNLNQETGLSDAGPGNDGSEPAVLDIFNADGS